MKFHLLLSVFTHCIVAIPTITIVKSLGKRETCPLTRTDPDGFWYEQVNHNGISPFIQDGSSWPVFRNVKAYGAKGDGLTDDSAAIQDAIDAGNSFSGRSSNSLGTTGQPAVVYFPAGTYLLTRPLQLYVGTMVVGNPMHVPTLKATSTFNSNAMIRGKDPSHGSTDNFQIAIKNMIIDSQNVDRGTAITLLDWSISQACQLTNVVFHMPYESTGHTGVAMPEYGSPLMINDCAFIGGAVGVVVNTQQYHLKGLTFSGCSTGVKVKSTFDLVVQNCTFEFCTVGVDTSGTNIGFVAVIDSTANYVDTLISSAGSTTGADSLVLENVRVSETTWTVTAGGIGVLMGGVSANQAWVWGKAYAADADGSRQVTGTTFDTVRPSVLTDRSGTFKTVRPPTYQEYSAGQVINVKDVPDYLVTGDGATDDTASLQHIITTYAGCKILFFPHGTYLVTDTLTFPPGSRVFGEAWSAISAKGSAFTDATHPRPMIRVGEPGDVGVAQFSDMFFTVADVLPGCTLLEVNMAGEEAGDVGFWNTHIRVGGATGSRVRTSCAGTPGECSAAFMMVHLTASSSAYIDNMWAWTADHDLDGNNGQTISTGRGMLIEATKGTWLLGLGIEHSTLYQANYHNAQNVFAGFQQSESPYWQGSGSPSYAPDPWRESGLPSDPDFSWCAPEDGQCRMALYLRISGSTNLSLYGSGFWTFFNHNQLCSGNCQAESVQIENTEGLYYFGLNTRFVDALVRHEGDVLATSSENAGGWGAVVAAFLKDSW